MASCQVSPREELTEANAFDVAHSLAREDRLAKSHVLPVMVLMAEASVAPAAVSVLVTAVHRTELGLALVIYSLNVAISLDHAVIDPAVTIDIAQAHMLLAFPTGSILIYGSVLV